MTDDTPSMNDLLRAAAGAISPERRAELERQVAPPDPNAGIPDIPASVAMPNARDTDPKWGRPLTTDRVMNAMLRDAVESRRYNRPKANTVGDLKYLLDDPDAA